jgi:hypothetical protein
LTLDAARNLVDAVTMMLNRAKAPDSPSEGAGSS